MDCNCCRFRTLSVQHMASVVDLTPMLCTDAAVPGSSLRCPSVSVVLMRRGSGGCDGSAGQLCDKKKLKNVDMNSVMCVSWTPSPQQAGACILGNIGSR